MKGYKFYLEYPSISAKKKGTCKAPGNHNGTCVAVVDDSRRGFMHDAIAAVYNEPNSAVCTTTVSDNYIVDQCKRIGEEQARTIHPALFKVLDSY